MTDAEMKHQLEQLLHTINHDLRTPLSNIRSATGILMHTLANSLTPEQLAFVEIIERSTVRLLDQTNRLMLFGQIAFTANALESIQLSELLGNIKRSLKNVYDIDTVTIVSDSDPVVEANVHTLSATLALLAAGDSKYLPDVIPDNLPVIQTHTLPGKLCFTIHSLMPAPEVSSSLVELSREIVRQHGSDLEIGELDGQKQFSFCIPLSPSAA